MAYANEREYVVAQVRDMIAGADIAQAYTERPENTQTTDWIYVELGPEKVIDGSEGYESKVWESTWGGEMHVLLDSADTNAEGLAKSRAEAIYSDLRRAIMPREFEGRYQSWDTYKVSVQRITLDEWSAPIDMQETEIVATLLGTVVYTLTLISS